MELFLDRIKSNDIATLGKLSVNTKFECYVCEDDYDAVKEKGNTRIPAGRYEVELKPLGTSRFDASYTKKFRFHAGMLRLKNVPNYAEVLIHIGNTHKDTEGCLLVGKSAVVTATSLAVAASTDAYKDLYPKVREALRKEKVWITIVDHDLKGQ
jgi:hypothetical protein